MQWDAITYLLKSLKLKWLTIPRDGEKIEPLEWLYTACGSVKWCNHFA